jgi:hypothetical protein
MVSVEGHGEPSPQPTRVEADRIVRTIIESSFLRIVNLLQSPPVFYQQHHPQ